MTPEEVRALIATISDQDDGNDYEQAHYTEDQLLTAIALAFAPPDIKAELAAYLATERVRWYS